MSSTKIVKKYGNTHTVYEEKDNYEGSPSKAKPEGYKTDLDTVMQKQLDLIERLRSENNEITFKHSGKLGDIIYSIPAMRAIAGEGRSLRLLIDIGESGLDTIVKASPEMNIGRKGYEA